MLEYFEKVSAVLKEALAGAYVNGKWLPGGFEADKDILIIEPQPVKANDLQMLPEGQRTANWLKTWIDESVLPRQGNNDSSIIVYKGKEFFTYQVNDWQIDGNFYRLFIREITDDESRYHS